MYSFPNAIFMLILMPVVSVRSSIFENHSSVNSSPLKKTKTLFILLLDIYFPPSGCFQAFAELHRHSGPRHYSS